MCVCAHVGFYTLLRNASRTINETLQTLEQTHKERLLNQTLQQETAGECECVCDLRPDYTIGVMPIASGGLRLCVADALSCACFSSCTNALLLRHARIAFLKLFGRQPSTQKTLLKRLCKIHLMQEQRRQQQRQGQTRQNRRTFLAGSCRARRWKRSQNMLNA